MRYRTYEAETLQQAILKMTIDLGKDALLVSHRTIKKGGFLGIGAKRMVEVTGAVPIGRRSLITKEVEKEFPSPEGLLVRHFRRELDEIKSKIDRFVQQERRSYPGYCGELYVRLIHHEVDEEIANNLIGNVIKKASVDEYKDRGLLMQRLREEIMNLVDVSGPIQLNRDSPKVISLIGPTGVGKTTTLAKLAAHFVSMGKRVASITIDTYRIAAVEQLRTYTRILGIPLEVVFTPVDFKHALDKYKGKDIVFIDTAGRSHRNCQHIDELREFVNQDSKGIESILVISATTKYKDMVDIINSFKKVRFQRIIFTKLDETVTFGPMVNTLARIQQPLSYITIGQGVPEDIEVASPARIANLILGE